MISFHYFIITPTTPGWLVDVQYCFLAPSELAPELKLFDTFWGEVVRNIPAILIVGHNGSYFACANAPKALSVTR